MSDLELTHGEDRVLDVAVTDGAGAVVDITGSSFWWTLKPDWLTADAGLLIQKSVGSGIVITDAANGLATITLDATDWAAIANDPAQYVWGLVEKAADTTIYRLDSGTLLLAPAVFEVLP